MCHIHSTKTFVRLYVVFVSCLDLLIQQAALRGRSVRSGTLHTARLFMLFYTKLLRGSYVPDRMSLCVCGLLCHVISTFT